MGDKTVNRVRSKAADVHRILRPHHLSGTDVINDSPLVRREVDLVRGGGILAHLLQHARAIFWLDGLEGVAAELESLIELLFGQLRVDIRSSLNNYTGVSI